jgi:class 3 adenylate cyclase/ketosteroid isomerase-like protein
MLRVTVCGGVAVEADGRRLPDALLAGRQGRLVLAYLVCERHRSVPRDELADLVWGEALPSSWAASLSAVVSKLRRLLGEAGLDGPEALASAFGSYRVHLPEGTWIDWEVVAGAVERAEAAVRAGAVDDAVAAGREAQDIARRGFLHDDSPWVDAQRDRLHDWHVRALQAQADAHLRAGAPSRAVAAARDALELDGLRETTYRLLMQALAAAGERGEALRVWERCRVMLVEELGTDPAPETEAVYRALLGFGDEPVAAAPATPTVATALPSGVVTFLLTDIVDSSGLWERDSASMAKALARHDELVGEVVARHAGVLLKAKLEGDATVSVFPRASAGALAALDLRAAMLAEEWPEQAVPAIRMALHTGEALERDGDYFGPALNRAARLRGLASGGQILVSQAVAEVVRDHLPDDAPLRSLGEHQLRGLARSEHVFELAPSIDAAPADSPPALARPPIPSLIAARGVFVGRTAELEALATEWATATAGTVRAMFIAGEPGVGKTRLAAEWAREVYEQNGIVLYGRCDEELGAPYQPFAEALRSLVPHLGARRLRGIRGIEELARLVPDLNDQLPATGHAGQVDPDTERYLLFDAFVRLLASVSSDTPVLIVVDDLHWAAKPTLLLLRHLLRSGDGLRVQIVGTYRSTDLDRTHPLAATLADLHRDGTADRLLLTGLATEDVTEYLRASGFDDTRFGAALSTVTSGNPFFLIEVLRHVEETGGHWDPGTLPQGVREAVGRRLTRLSDRANDALLAGAVVGSRFSIDLVETVMETDVVDAIEEARHAGLVVEEAGNRYRFNHALVRQALLAEVGSVKRIRLHQRIAAALEADTDAGDAHLADLARHTFECAYAGAAAKAVDYARRAGEQAMARLAYEEAADLFDRAIQAADIDGSGCDEDGRAELLLARCEALLAAGDPHAAVTVVTELERAARNSPSLSAWATCYAAQLALLTHPERLEAIERDVAAAAERFAQLDDVAGEAKAYTIRAQCLALLGRVADCEAALDHALTAARKAGSPRRVNAVLAGAPLAALWGPSPVARASGRCLDVVRVLRITTGSPAVEAVALRCQAVLEALRGRTDAARRMIGSARRALESLGHTHGLLEIDIFAGIVDLIAGEVTDAELVLRRAYDGLLARGVGVDAAQAGALLARAVLARGRVDEAIALTEESERLAGIELKSAIAWRSARAEALAQQGRVDEAVALARAAVALSEPTDGLIDQADAYVSLATVLRTAGEDAEADSAANRAVELYERKGATARADSVRALMSVRPGPVAPAGGSGAARRRVRRNLATERLLARAMDEAEVQRLAAELAPDFSGFDHRMQHVYDRDSLIETWRSMAVVRGAYVESERIASLGTRHGVTRFIWRSDDPTGSQARTGFVEVHWLAVFRANDRGELERLEAFNPQDMRLALARLLELHAEAELPPDERLPAIVLAQQFREGRFLWSDDAIIVDHRPGGLGTITGHEALRVAAEGLRGIAGEFTREIADVIDFRERINLTEFVSHGHTEHGDPVEIAVLAIGQSGDDGRCVRAEWYLPEQIDEAIARFDELVGAPAAEPLANAATGAARRISHAIVAGDRTALVSMLAPGIVIEDRRPMFRTMMVGRDDVIANMANVRNIGVSAIDVDVVATRGERLALMRDLYRGRDGEVEDLYVIELGDDGACISGCHFAPTDADAAFDELDARYLSGEGAPYAPALSVTFGIVSATNRREWAQVRSYFDDAMSIVDHSPAPSAFRWVHTPDELIALVRGSLDSAPELRTRVLSVRLAAADGVVVSECRTAGRTRDGSDVEFAMYTLQHVKSGSIVRVEFYGPDQRDAALARVRELAGSEGIRNRATEVTADILDAFRRRDWDAIVAMAHPDATGEDRRLVIGGGLRSEGRDAFLQVWRGMAEIGVREVPSTVLAIRGDLLTLQLGHPGGAAGYDDALFVHEIHPDGRYLGGSVFSISDADAAYDFLDERYLAGEGSQHDESRCFLDFIGRVNHRDWAGCRELLDDSFVTVDHRPPPSVYASVEGPDEFVAAMQVGDAKASVRSRVDALPLVGQGAVVGIVRRTVIARRGGEMEVISNLVGTIRSGRVTRLELFAAEDLDAAIARAEELRGSPDAGLDNRAAQVSVRILESFRRRDWDALRSQVAENVVAIDRRAVVGGEVYHGPDGIVAMWQGVAAIGVSEVVTTPVASRGDRLVLFHGLYVGPHAESEMLMLCEVDARGLFVYGPAYDATDMEAALAEMDARFAASTPGGAEYLENDATRWWEELSNAFKTRDWSTMEARVAADAVVDDCRTVVGGMRYDGADEVNGLWRSMAGIGVTHVEVRTVATRGHAFLAHSLMSGEIGESENLFIYEFTDEGQFFYGMGLDSRELDAAFAELDRRYAKRCPAPWETVTAFIDAYNARDWERFGLLHREDVACIDHRPAVWGQLNRAEFVATVRTLVDLAPDMDLRVLSVLETTDRAFVVVLRAAGTNETGGEFEMAWLGAGRVDDGLLSWEFFPLDDEAAALKVIAAGALVNAATEQVVQVLEWIVSRNRAALDAIMADDVVMDDRRRILGMRIEGKEAVGEYLDSIGQIGVSRIDHEVVAIRGDRLALIHEVLRADGDEGEAEVYFVYECGPDGKNTFTGSFDPVDVDAAFAELDARYALQAKGDELTPEAAAVWRTVQQLIDFYNARDRDSLRAIFADDAVIVDERVTGWGTQAPDEFAGHLEQLIAMAPDVTLACVAVQAIEAHGMVARFRVTGTVPGGGLFENQFEITGVVRDGKLARLDLLPEGEIDEALRRLAAQ